MSKMYWLRVFFLVAFLGAVVWSMRRLNSGASPPLLPSTASTSVSLCPTRISWIESEEWRLEEKRTKWYRTTRGSGQARELDPIAVEKWVSRLCSIDIQSYNAGREFPTLLKIGFVAGPVLEVFKATSGEFQAQGHAFFSKELSEVLRTLPELPAVKAPGAP